MVVLMAHCLYEPQGLIQACMCREKYAGGPTNSVTRKELGALFDVTGTPSWRDVEGVQSATWRNYLQKLPGRAPTLYRRLGFAGRTCRPT